MVLAAWSAASRARLSKIVDFRGSFFTTYERILKWNVRPDRSHRIVNDGLFKFVVLLRIVSVEATEIGRFKVAPLILPQGK